MIIQLLVRWAVPTFVILSGFLLLRPEKEMPLPKICRYAARMGIVLLTIGYVFCLIESVMAKGSERFLLQMLLCVKNLAEGKSWAHMWYVYMLLGLYLLTPMLKAFIAHTERKTLEFTLIVLLALTLVRPSLDFLLGTKLETLIPVATPYLFYYLVGYYLDRYPVKKAHAYVAVVVGLAGIAAELVVWRSAILIVTQPDNVFVALYAMGIFALCRENEIMERAAGVSVVASISKYSFGIYLFHTLFLNILNKGLHVFPDALPIGVGEAVFFSIALAGSYITARGFCRIESISKILL